MTFSKSILSNSAHNSCSIRHSKEILIPQAGGFHADSKPCVSGSEM